MRAYLGENNQLFHNKFVDIFIVANLIIPNMYN